MVMEKLVGRTLADELAGHLPVAKAISLVPLGGREECAEEVGRYLFGYASGGLDRHY